MDKRFFLAALLLFTALILLAACGADVDAPDDAPNPIAFVADGAPQVQGGAARGALGDDVPISRGLVAKMISLTFSDMHAIDHTTRYISFADTHVNLWHDRFINTAVGLGHLSGMGGYFYPEHPLTLEQAQLILDRLDPNNPIRIQLTPENRHRAISYALWVNLYTQLLNNLSGYDSVAERFGIIQQDVIVLVTSEFNRTLPSGHIITNMGHFAASGLSFADYLDKEVTILHRDREIIAILAISNTTPTIRSAYIVAAGTGHITIFAGGAERSYEFDASAPPPSAGSIADVRINGRMAETVQVLGDIVVGVVKQVTNSFIEIEGIGLLTLHESFSIYNAIANPVTMSDASQITIGYNVADFVLRDGQVAAAIIRRRPTTEHIRVVLSTTGFGSRVHQSVSLRSESGLTIHANNDVLEIPPNEIFTLSTMENMYLIETGRITIVPNDSGTTEITSIGRNWPDGAFPRYRGIIEISRRIDGFVIVNQLPMEEYLYAVIPSEMPASFGLEAAKAQAITARSYAYNAFFANRFYMYGANVDDSVASQVYNNFPETATAIDAVDATRGRVLTYGGQVISANFFSTSAGHTANSGDVWINGTTWEFDRPTPTYLSAQSQYLAGDFGDLSLEDNASAFFTDTEIQSFDDHSPWFRWNFRLSHAELTEIIGRNLPRLATASPHLFQMPDTADFPPQFGFEIGEFQSMEVISRGQGGNIRELLITGSTNSVLVRTEYTIRQLLTPATAAGVALNRHNALPIQNHFILPSTFMTFTADGDGVAFFGGGFGHGVGMSQNGAYGMVQRGHSYEEILAHFYPGAQLTMLTR